jgi:hypothetical protein
MDDFSQTIRSLGPVRDDENRNEARLDIITRLIPYIKLVIKERFYIAGKSEKAYKDFFTGADFNRLYKELIEERLYLAEMESLLAKGPHTLTEISEKTGIGPHHISGYMRSLANYGIINYNRDGKGFYIAGCDPMR